MTVLALTGCAIFAGLVGAGLAGVTITVFLHRGLTHGAYRVSRPIYDVGRLMTFLTVFMRHWEWRLVHRKHHLYSDLWIDDVRHDPHSPILISERQGIDGFRRVAWHMAAIFHAAARSRDIRDGTYELAGDRALDWFDRYGFNRPVVGAMLTGTAYATAFALGAPDLLGLGRTPGSELLCVAGGLLALGVHVTVMLRFGGAINSDCHRGEEFVEGAGYAKNVGLLSFLIFGEGEHLTHHLHPELAQISARWDLGWRVITVLRRLRLTEVAVERG